MLGADGWFDWAIRDPGPEDRALYMGGRPTAMTTITHHSLEGWFRLVTEPGSGYNVMRDPNRFPTAWHWTVALGGTVYQHYPVWARLVHGNAANILGPGGESEGLAPTPLNGWQVDSWLRIHSDMREAYPDREFLRVPGSRRGLVEHREMGPTGCPSERYAPLWRASEEDDMATIEALEKRIAELERRTGGDAGKDFDLLVGLQENQRALTAHLAEHALGHVHATHSHILPATTTGGPLP